jgi:hypothetical protein
MLDLLWITYAWADNDEGNFDFLVQQLADAGIAAIYDKVALIPGRKLWDQIAARISSDPLSGWAYLVTPNSLTSAPCQEELSYALQRTLDTKGEEFPLIGLLHNVSIRDVPLSLRVRLCVNLANPDWIEEIRAGVAGKPPQRNVPDQAPYIIKIQKNYLGQQGKNAIEIRPRFGEIRYWRLAFPTDGPHPTSWGSGPANGGGLSGIKTEMLEGEFEDLGGMPMKFVGAGNPLTPATSAYLVFDQTLPTKVFFGVSNEAFSVNVAGNIFIVSDLESHIIG